MSLRFRLLVAAAVLVWRWPASGTRSSARWRTPRSSRSTANWTWCCLSRAGLTQGPGRFLAARPRFSANGRSGLSNELKLSDMYVATIDNGQVHTVRLAAVRRRRHTEGPASPVAVAVRRPARDDRQLVRGSGRWRAVTLRTFSGRDVLVALYMGPVDATASELRVAVLAAGGIVAAILLACGFWLERLGFAPDRRDEIRGGRHRGRRPDAKDHGDQPRGKEAAHLAARLNTMLDKQNEIEDRAPAVRRRRIARTAHADVRHLGPRPAVAAGRPARRAASSKRPCAGWARKATGCAPWWRSCCSWPVSTPAPTSKPGTVDLGRLARDVLADAAITHPSRHVTARIDDNATALGDESELRRIISNLVTNALTHTPGTSRVVRRGEDAAPASACFEISDTGPGMATDDAAHAFERFWRAAPSRTRSGSGLGLSIARAVVEADGGTIELDSTPEAGTTVRVVLPGWHRRPGQRSGPGGRPPGAAGGAAGPGLTGGPPPRPDRRLAAT